MPTETVNATLLVGDGLGGSRQLTIDDLKAAATGDATEVTLSGLKSANHTDLAALATALGSILTKLTADPSTGAKQDTLHADLAELVVLHADLAAILAKESADPATQTTLSALVAANHTDLAAILAKDEAIRALLAGTLLVESSSASKGQDQLTSTAAAATVPSLCTGAALPTGATKAIFVPSAAVRFRDDATNPSATVGFPVAASQPFKYDGDKLSTLKVYGAATIDVWFYA